MLKKTLTTLLLSVTISTIYAADCPAYVPAEKCPAWQRTIAAAERLAKILESPYKIKSCDIRSGAVSIVIIRAELIQILSLKTDAKTCTIDESGRLILDGEKSCPFTWASHGIATGIGFAAGIGICAGIR